MKFTRRCPQCEMTFEFYDNDDEAKTVESWGSVDYSVDLNEFVRHWESEHHWCEC